MKPLEGKFKEFNELNTVAVGISVDPIPSKKSWEEKLRIEKTIFLTDFWPHGEVAKK